MCAQCDEKVRNAEANYLEALDHYRDDIAEGAIKGTESERVCDLAAILFAFICRSMRNGVSAAWMLALAMERSVERETRGVDMRLIAMALNEKRCDTGREPLPYEDIVEMYQMASELSRHVAE
jgi:hypothetical protein